MAIMERTFAGIMLEKIMRHILIASALAVLIAGSFEAAAAPMITNPSFEDPGHSDANDFIVRLNGSTFVTGWTVGGAGVDYFRGAVFASDGNYSINYVRGPNQGGSIFTTITGLTLGVTYKVSFDLIQSELSAGTALTASVDATMQTFINAAVSVYEQKDLLFVAGGTTALLTFAGPTTGAVDAAFAHIDNVSIAEVSSSVPEPGTLALFGLGLAGLGFARRRKAA